MSHLSGGLLEASPGLDLLENCRVYTGYIPGKVVFIAWSQLHFIGRALTDSYYDTGYFGLLKLFKPKSISPSINRLSCNQ